MTIETTLFSTLDNDATLTGLVASRIYPQVAPDNATIPYITYQVIVGSSHSRLKGAAGSERKLIQLNCISNTYSEAKSVAVAARSAINGTVGYCNSESDDYFSEIQRHRVMLDVSLIG